MNVTSTLILKPQDKQSLLEAIERNEREISGLQFQLSGPNADQTRIRIDRLKLVNRAYRRLLAVTGPSRQVSVLDGGFDLHAL